MIPEDRRYRYIAFDPGSRTFGWTIIDKDVETGEIQLISAGTLKRSDLLNRSHKELIELNSESSVGWKVMTESLEELLHLYGPSAIVYESAHFKRRMVNAFKVLSMASAFIQMLGWHYNPDMPIIPFQPNEGKVAVGVKAGDKDKTKVQEGVKSREDVFWADPDLKDELDEHAFDAIAIGLAYNDQYLKQT